MVSSRLRRYHRHLCQQSHPRFFLHSDFILPPSSTTTRTTSTTSTTTCSRSCLTRCRWEAPWVKAEDQNPVPEGISDVNCRSNSYTRSNIRWKFLFSNIAAAPSIHSVNMQQQQQPGTKVCHNSGGISSMAGHKKVRNYIFSFLNKLITIFYILE